MPVTGGPRAAGKQDGKKELPNCWNGGPWAGGGGAVSALIPTSGEHVARKLVNVKGKRPREKGIISKCQGNPALPGE